MKLLILLFASAAFGQVTGVVTSVPPTPPQAAVPGSVKAVAGGLTMTIQADAFPATKLTVTVSAGGSNIAFWTLAASQIVAAPAGANSGGFILQGDTIIYTVSPPDVKGAIAWTVAAAPFGGTSAKASGTF